AVVAANNATKAIPIVMINVGDPVGLGLIANLAHPGGNLTGMSFSVGMETFGKGLELLKEAVPKIRLVAVRSEAANPAHTLGIRTLRSRPSHWECSFNSSRPAVPTSSMRHSRRWPKSAWEHSS